MRKEGTRAKVPTATLTQGVSVCHPPSPWCPKTSTLRRVTSVQHDVVDHVAFVFGVIEAERTAKIFGALLGNRRMPSFHVHSKSRSEKERGEGGERQ